MVSVGLSIDSSESGCGDLSDSDCSFHLWRQPDDVYLPPPRGMTMSLDSEISFPLERCDPHSRSLPVMGHDESSRPSSRIKSIRTQIRRRLEEFQQRDDEIALQWEEGLMQYRRPRLHLRFCVTLCALTLVLLSFSGGANVPALPPTVDVRREKMVFPLHKESVKQPGLPRDALPKVESPKMSGKIRSNWALARAQAPRPVFEANPKMERFVMETYAEVRPKQSPRANWTTWLAGMALACMLIEAAYKEYRRCRIDSDYEVQRRR